MAKKKPEPLELDDGPPIKRRVRPDPELEALDDPPPSELKKVAKQAKAAIDEVVETVESLKSKSPRPKKPAAPAPEQTGHAVVRSLDTARLTKRQQTARDRHQKRPAAFWDERMTLASQQTGKKQIVVPITEQDVPPCVPLPSLALEYLLGITGWPLGTFAVQLAGREGSFKSSFLLEVFRWFARCGGGGRFYDHESKATPQFIRLLLEDYFHRVKACRCANIEAWQSAVSSDLKDFKEKILGTDKEPGPGKIFPVGFGIDSVMGKSTEKAQERVEESGHGSKGYPDAAAVMTDYLKTRINDFEDWPFSLIFVNHSKESIPSNPTERAQRTTPGSRQLRHQLGLDLEFSALMTQQCATFRHVPVSIRSWKNTVGPTHGRVQTRVRSWNQVVEGKSRQTMRWDWAWTDIHFLLKNEEPIVRHALKQADFHLKVEKSGVDYQVSSKTLGISSKSPIRSAEAYDLIHGNPELLNHLRAHLGIQVWPVLEGAAKLLTQEETRVEPAEA